MRHEVHCAPYWDEMPVKRTLLINLCRASCTNYLMSIHILRFSVQVIKIKRPDKKTTGKHIVSSQDVAIENKWELSIEDKHTLGALLLPPRERCSARSSFVRDSSTRLSPSVLPCDWLRGGPAAISFLCRLFLWSHKRVCSNVLYTS